MIGPAIPESFANMEPVMNDMILVPRQFVQAVAALPVEDIGPGLMADAMRFKDAAPVVEGGARLSDVKLQELLDEAVTKFPAGPYSMDISANALKEFAKSIQLQAPSPSQSTPRLTVDDAMVERAAKAIYECRAFGTPQDYPWVPRGNSFRQDAARDYARAALLASLPQGKE